MSAFTLKLIAIITMSLDHLGYVINGGFSEFNYIGRIAFPIFAFQISEGYLHTKSLKKYIVRLSLFAIISQIPFMLFELLIGGNYFTLNVFFTLLLGLVLIICYDKINNIFLKLLSMLSILIVAYFINCDYGIFGVIIIWIFYALKNSPFTMSIYFIIAVFFKYLFAIITNNYFCIEYVILAFFNVVPIFFILLYNGRKGPNTKYLLYFFYPLHLLALYAISFFI